MTTGPGHEVGTKDAALAIKQLAALAHHGRLGLFFALIQAGPKGRSAGALARGANIAATTGSSQLLVLQNASLISSSREGRRVMYHANYPAIARLLRFLLEENHCGHAEIVDRLAADSETISPA